MSATLLELDNHPGLGHVRLYPPTGVTAQRWAVIEKSLAQLWEDLGRMTSIVDSARMVRERRSEPNNDDRAELTKLLRERPLEVSRQPIPLAQRQIGGIGEQIEYVGLADTRGADAQRIPCCRRIPRRCRSDQLACRREARADAEATRRGGHGRTTGDRRAVADLRDRSTLPDHAGG